ncbi:hypothetical protein [Streptomyces sp. NRRL S-378]|uniref:hypothetical protein n=1 Tax=Streptomyces sp. NRRL S-378 TaxID=1463904 RepID=UPI0004C4D51F|nr:hypothetical protein [Streptomyces sp. NRRL S-378]
MSTQMKLTEFLQDYARLDAVDASLFAERFLTQHAHELAEQIRTTDLPEIHVDMFDNGAQWAANLIDPEVTA